MTKKQNVKNLLFSTRTPPEEQRHCLLSTKQSKQELREQLARDTEAFLAEGRQIDAAPPAVDDTNHRPVVIQQAHVFS